MVLLSDDAMIELGTGSLLDADVDAFVNTVNTVGVMGKGLALQFKKAFPEAAAAYERACKAGEVQVGRMLVVPRLAAPHFIINFPTKKHWRQPSKLEYVRTGLLDLAAQVRRLRIRSLAIPPLGCGNGGLDWAEVRPLIVQCFESMPDVRVVLFEPQTTPSAEAAPGERKTPAMTPGRAAVIALMARYLETGYEYRLSLFEVQKLAYFLQEAQEPLRLEYRADWYGPYADNLRKVLRSMNGQFTRGAEDGTDGPETSLELLPGAAALAQGVLASRPETDARVERVMRLIEGFETPFGLELLGTVHWASRDGGDPDDVQAVIAKVRAHNAGKHSPMQDGHITAAWTRLREQGWLTAASKSAARCAS